MGNIRGFSLPIAVRQTATTAAAAVVWAMLNPLTSKKPLYLRRLFVNVMFDGTPAASQSQYLVKRFRGTTIIDGTALTPQSHNRLDKGALGVNQVSAVTAAFLDTGLTLAGITFDGAGIVGAPAVFGNARQVAAGAQYAMDYDAMDSGSGFSGRGAFCLDIGDGVALVLGQTAVVGDGIQGYASWDEMGGPG